MKYIGLMLCLTLLAQSSLAAHITDKLVIGLYETAEKSEAPLRLLSSGTAVQILNTEKGFSQVLLADQTEGWVESSYLSEEKPASMKLLEAQAKIRRLKSRLLIAGGGSKALPSITNIKQQQSFKQAQARVETLEKALQMLPAALAAQKELADLEARVAEVLFLLKDEPVAKIDAAQVKLKAQDFVAKFLPWIIGVLAAVLGFAAGVAFIDRRIRKRYGGFRI